MKLFTAIQHDAQLLSHFLAHYRRAGVAEFFIAVDPKFEPTIADVMSCNKITVFRNLDVDDSVVGEVSAVTKMREHYQKADEWVVIVDLDEFVEFDLPLHDIIRLAEGENANVVRAIMWDRFSEDGRVGPVTPGLALEEVYPIRARFIQNVMMGADFKGVLVKGHLESRSAHHTFFSEIVCSHQLDLSHYKWTEGAIDRLRAAHQRVAAAGRPFALEYARVLDHYDQHGRFVWDKFGGELAPRASADEIPCAELQITNETAALRAELRKTIDQSAALRAKLQRTTNESEALRAQRQKATEEITILRSQSELVEQTVVQLATSMSELTEKIHALEAAAGREIAGLKADREQAKNELAAVLNSTTWRITAPLRAIVRFIMVIGD
jgi:Glycosyl transferase family 2